MDYYKKPHVEHYVKPQPVVYGPHMVQVQKVVHPVHAVHPVPAVPVYNWTPLAMVLVLFILLVIILKSSFLFIR